MPGVRRGRVVRLGLVGVLLLPVGGGVTIRAAARSAPTTEPTAAAQLCAVTSADLDVDLDRACSGVRAAVPSWHGIAVVQVVEGDEAVAAETLGVVISVHREAWARLTAAGRQVVLTHELVHVATAAFTTPRTPQWLIEGLADAVALRDSDLPDRVVAQELAALVRRGAVPRRLPADADFATTPALAYQQSWLAVDLLLRRFGDAAVLRLYRAAGSGPVAEALSLLDLRLRSASAAADRRRPAGADTRRHEVTVGQLETWLRAEIVRRLS